MLQGIELGAAIKAAMKLKKVTQREVAEEFEISQPSVSAWTRTGRIDKHHLDHLFEYFSDVVGPSHWGLKSIATASYDNVLGRAIQQIEEEIRADLGGLSMKAVSLAKRFDALKDDERRRLCYALLDNTLQQFEAADEPAGPRSRGSAREPRKPKRRSAAGR